MHLILHFTLIFSYGKKEQILSFSMIYFLFHNSQKRPSTLQTKVAGRNCIFPPLGIEYNYRSFSSISHRSGKSPLFYRFCLDGCETVFNWIQFPTVEKCDFDRQFLFEKYSDIYDCYKMKNISLESWKSSLSCYIKI